MARRAGSAHAVCADLVGLQAQENRSPFLGLEARLDGFDPATVTEGLESRTLVRIVCLRGTIHLVTADDALMIRGWTWPVQDRERQVSQNLRAVRDLDLEAFRPSSRGARRRTAVGQGARGGAVGPLPRTSGHRLAGLARVGRADGPGARAGPGAGPAASSTSASTSGWAARSSIPTRPTWCAATWVPSARRAGRHHRLVRRPRRRNEVVAAMPDLVGTRTSPAAVGRRPGRARSLTPTGPPRCVCSGQRDNLGSPTPAASGYHTPEARQRGRGSNGGLADTVFVDGMLEGLWRVVDGRVADAAAVPHARRRRTGRPGRRGRPGEGVAGELTWRVEQSAPAVGARQQGGHRRDAGGGGAQDLGAQVYDVSAGGGEGRQLLLGDQPALGADDEGDPRRLPRARPRTAGLAASSCSTSARSQEASNGSPPERPSRAPRPSGTRRDGPAWRLRAPWPASGRSDLAARSPRQTATDCGAAQGTIRSTPTSVSTSTASSPRSPLGRAWTTRPDADAGGTRSTDSMSTSRHALAHVATPRRRPGRRRRRSAARAHRPRKRRTATAWCASSPSTTTVPPASTPVRVGTRWTGSDIRR